MEADLLVMMLMTSATDSYTNHRGTVVRFRDENRGLKNVYRAQIGGTTYGTQASNAGTGAFR